MPFFIDLLVSLERQRKTVVVSAVRAEGRSLNMFTCLYNVRMHVYLIVLGIWLYCCDTKQYSVVINREHAETEEK